MPETLSASERLATVQAYHQRTKHQLQRYANGPETLDWDAQPNPFRRYQGAPLTPLPLGAESLATPWADLFVPGQIAPAPLNLGSIGALFELSLALAAWKQAGPDRWAVRVNPSSGNLHPTEGWLISRQVPGLADGVHHYAPHEHALELRGAAVAGPADAATDSTKAPQAWLALSSIQWREAWKYGERAFRYCQLDTGHALGALRYAAALLGWRLIPQACSAAELAHRLGLDRAADFGRAEAEEPEALLAIVPARPGAEAAASPWPPAWPEALQAEQLQWQGQANRLDAHPMYRWPVIDQVAQASRPAGPTSVATLSAAQSGPLAAPRAGSLTSPPAAEAGAAHAKPRPAPKPAALLLRQRRSAQRFDARARLPLAQLWPLLAALAPQRLPFDVLGSMPGAKAQPQVHVLLFAHRVDGLPPGAYLLPRGEGALARLRAALPADWLWQPVAEAPSEVPLQTLVHNPALAGTLRTLNCHQALGSDAILGFALLAEFNPLPEPSAYRERLQEAGLIGHVLYLEAEALGLAGTGIGCFFDDALHELIGLQPSEAAQAALQSVYHFTVGQPVFDPRIASEPPYMHLKAHLSNTSPDTPPGETHV